MLRLTLAALAAFLLAVGTLWSQSAIDSAGDPDDRKDLVEQLGDNLNRLSITVSVDRSTLYFPGELATVTVTIKNPTSEALEIPDPNDPAMQKFQFLYKEKTGWHPSGLDDSVFEWPPLDQLHTTTIRPGQVVTLTFHPEEQEVGSWSFERGKLGLGVKAGPARLEYLLNSGTVDFEVAKPLLESSALVPLHLFKTWTSKGEHEPTTEQQAAMIVAVQLAGEHVLFAATKNTTARLKIKPEKDGTFSDAVLGAPWVRLATVPAKVAKITATTDANDLITLQYETTDGGTGTIYLDKNRHPL